MNVYRCSYCSSEFQGFHSTCPSCGKYGSFQFTNKHPLSLIKPLEEKKFPDDELMAKIYDLRGSYMRKYALVPNTVYLGHDEYFVLKNYRLEFANETGKINEVLGMKIKRIIEDNHISVGLSLQ